VKPARAIGGPGDTIDSSTAIVSHPAVTPRARRIRRDARRALDELLGVAASPLVLVDRGDFWHTTWMDRGFPERERRGLEVLAAGWTP
jgi:hypothetical protein